MNGGWLGLPGTLPDADWVQLSFLNSVPVFFPDFSDSLSDVHTATHPRTQFSPNPAQLGSGKASSRRPDLCAPLDGNVGPRVPAPDPEPVAAVLHVPKSQCKSRIQKSLRAGFSYKGPKGGGRRQTLWP